MALDMDNLNSYCRCCLNTSEMLKPLFGVSLDSMLFSLVGIKMEKDDGYPQQICNRCILKLSSSFTFQQMVLASHETLKGFIQQTKNNVIENINNTIINYEELDNVVDMEVQLELNDILDTKSVDVESIESNENLSLDDKEVSEPKHTTFKCTVCKTHFDNKSELKQHMHKHKETCKVCFKGILKQNKARHARTHSDVKSRRCSYCLRAFADSTNLKRHEQTHTGKGNEQPYLCCFCGKKFKWQTSMYRHLRYHTGSKMRNCHICDKKFPNPGSLKIHLSTHLPDKKYVCEICGSSFKLESSFNRHTLGHGHRHMLGHGHRNKHECPVCQKEYMKKDSLERHILKVHREKVLRTVYT